MTTENQETTAAPAPEPSMAEYASNWGKAPAPAETSAPEPETEESAAPAEATETKAETVPEPETDKVDEDPEAKLEDAHPAKKGIGKRMSELASARKAAEEAAAAAKAEAEAAREELARLRADAQAQAQEQLVPVVPPADQDPAPVREAFEDPDEYAAALAGHTARSEIRRATEAARAQQEAVRAAADAKAEEARQAAVQSQIVELHKSFNERVEKAKADLPDFDSVVTNNADLQIRNDIFFAVEKAELAPYILHRLASNPAEAAALNKLDPMAAAIRLGEIQADIKAERKPKPSKAAEPIKPVGTRASPIQKTPDEMSMAEYAAYVNGNKRR